MAQRLRARDGQIDGDVARHPAGRHHGDAVAQVHGFGDVVRDEQHGGAALAAGAQQVVLQLGAGDGVERGEGFVEQQQRGLEDERAGQGDAALLPARQLARIALPLPRQAQLGQQPLRARMVGRRGPALQRHGQQHVVGHRLPVEQRGGLEHEAQLRAGRQHLAALHPHAARLRAQQPGGQLQQRGLAAAAAAHQAVDLARADAPAHAVDHRRAAGVGEHGVVDVEEPGARRAGLSRTGRQRVEEGVSRHRARTGRRRSPPRLRFPPCAPGRAG